MRRLQIKNFYAEKGRHKQNHKVDRKIGVLKQCWQGQMAALNVLAHLWDYGLMYEAELLS